MAWNEIGDEGAQAILDALKEQKGRIIDVLIDDSRIGAQIEQLMGIRRAFNQLKSDSNMLCLIANEFANNGFPSKSIEHEKKRKRNVNNGITPKSSEHVKKRKTNANNGVTPKLPEREKERKRNPNYKLSEAIKKQIALNLTPYGLFNYNDEDAVKIEKTEKFLKQPM